MSEFHAERQQRAPSPFLSSDLVQQLLQELRMKNMLFPKHHLTLGKVIGEGQFYLKEMW